MMSYLFADWQGGEAPPKGWDCADAIADGWTKADLDAFMRATVRPWTPPRGEASPSNRVDSVPSLAARSRPVGKAGVGGEPVTRAAVQGAATLKISDHLELRATESHDTLTVLDPRDPLPSARLLVSANYMQGEHRTLHHHRGAFHHWTGACYRMADADAITASTWSFLDKAKRWSPKDELIPFQPTRAKVGDVTAALAAACNLPAQLEPPCWLADVDMPPASEMLAVENGLLHLPSDELYPPTPVYFGSNATSVRFDPDAPDPVEWLRFLQLVWPDDPQSIETLQDIFGYLLSPDASQQKIMLIVGPKRSGKGTIARVLSGLLGQDSVCAPTLASLATNFGIAPLLGKSVAIVGDARLGSRVDQAAISERLLSISGEDIQTVDRKFLPPWTGRMGVRFMIMTNELPRLADASGALASRFVVLTMQHSFFGREDRGLAARLLNELPGILNWALDGYQRMRSRGYFLQPASACDAIDELEELGSPIGAFVKQRCVVSPGLHCTPDRLFDEWKSWCEENGRKEHGTKQSFGRDIRAAVPGIRVSQPRADGGRSRLYEGICVAPIATSSDSKW